MRSPIAGRASSRYPRLPEGQLLTDIRMPPGHQTEGIEAAHAIRQNYPQTGVVILSQYSDASYAVQLFRNGTDGLGYLLEASIGELDDLLHALREVTVRAGGRSELLTCLDGCGALKRLGTAAVRNRLKSVKSQYVTARR